jgi:DNA polymerase-3 subunit delta
MALGAEEALDRRIQSGDVEGAFFLHGDDEKLRDEAARRLAEAAVDPDTRDFNLDRFRGDDVEPEQLAGALNMPPMMADRRVVLLLRAEELTPTGRRVVEEAVEDLAPGLTFVITARIPSSKTKFYKRLKEGAVSFGWKSPGSGEIPGWLMERAERVHGFELRARAAQAMAAAVGEDLSLLDAELEKLSHAAEDGAVDVETVRSLVTNVRPVDRWDWLDRVASREYDSALGDLPVLLRESSESAVGLLVGMVDQHIYLGLALAGGRGRVERALTRAGKPYLKWKARIYAGQARNWSPGHLRRALRLMRRADRHAKSGLSDDAVMRELLVSLRAMAGS